MIKKHFQQIWDQFGIIISGLCAVHCLFFPVAIALLPLWPGAYAIHEWTHPILFLLIVPTVIFALWYHRDSLLIPFLLVTGLVLVGLAWLLHDWIGAAGEAGVTLIGSILLISGHWMNYQSHKSHSHNLKYHEAT